MLNLRTVNLKIFQFVFNLEQSKVIYGILILIVMALIPFAWYTFQYRGLDFGAYYQAAEGFHHGTRFYLDLMYTSTYYYPPLTAQILAPFSILPRQFLLAVWFILSVCAMCLSVYWVGGKQRYLTHLIICFGFFPVENMLYTGQVESFMLLALSLSFFFAKKNKDILSGVSLGIAILLKVIPIANFCYFIWRKKFKIVFSSLITILILCASSIPFIGWQGWQDFFHVAAFFANPPSMHGVNFGQLISAGSNQSISGFIARFIQNDAISKLIWRLCALAFLTATLIILWRRPKNGSQIFDLEFSLIIITINLIMPYTWYHQFSFFIIPILVIFTRAENNKNMQKYLGLLILGYVLTDIQLLLWHHLQNNFLLSTPLFFGLLLWVILAKQIYILKLRASARGILLFNPMKWTHPL